MDTAAPGKIKQVVIGERPRLIKIKNHPSKWRVDGQTNGRVHPGLISLEHHQRRSQSLSPFFAGALLGRGVAFFSLSLSLASFLFFSSAPRTQQATEREVIIIHSSRHCFKIQSTWHHCYARVVCLSLDPHSIGAVSERARGSTYYCVPVFKNNDLDFKSRTTTTPAQTRLTRLRAKIFQHAAAAAASVSLDKSVNPPAISIIWDVSTLWYIHDLASAPSRPDSSPGSFGPTA